MADFKQAVEWMKKGKSVTRKDWNTFWKMNRGEVLIVLSDNSEQTVTLSLEDYEAKDWKIYEEKHESIEFKIEVLEKELQVLGQEWRNDWSDFDGRQLRDQIEDLLKWFKSDSQKEYREIRDWAKERENERKW